VSATCCPHFPVLVRALYPKTTFFSSQLIRFF
jgi:hypothetical protein